MAPPSRKLIKTRYPGIYHRGNAYVVQFNDSQGKSRKRAAATITEARAVQAQIKADLAKGTFQTDAHTLFKDFAEQWLATYRGRTSFGIDPASLESYRRNLDRYAIPFLGKRKLCDIRPPLVKGFLAHLEANGLKANTRRAAFTPVRACFATAFEEGVIAANPCLNVRVYDAIANPDGEVKVKALSETELGALFGHLKPRHKFLLSLMVDTGLRIGEAIGVQWRDVDFATGRLHVQRQWSKGAYKLPKYRKKRFVPLSPNVLASLRQRRRAAHFKADEDLIFPSETGRPLSQWNLYLYHFTPAVEAAGIAWASFHTLRHTCATRLFRHGLNAKQVAAILGHASAGFTLNTYVHLLPDDLPDVAFLDSARPIELDRAALRSV